jgi:hypothetical protein
MCNSTKVAEHMIVETMYLGALRLSKGLGLPPKSGELGEWTRLGLSLAANLQAVSE